ncbi:VanZ family protein [Spirosoma luteum]|uniref:VanZ family protein n=1 Tax=Spirosoma luteum TaxID=431553 RepID=UPI00036EF417|nr:VanZ family protein [Spirosoma luteum]
MRIPPTAWRLLAIGWTITMLIGCLTPHDQIPSELNTWNDKSLHVLIFAPFTLLWMLTGLRMGYALVAGLLFGILIEALQYALPINRSADWKDVVADCVGAALGVGLAIFWQRLFPDSIS